MDGKLVGGPANGVGVSVGEPPLPMAINCDGHIYLRTSNTTDYLHSRHCCTDAAEAVEQ